MKALANMMVYYAGWYPRLWLPSVSSPEMASLSPALLKYVLFAKRTSKRLAREVFHQMLRYQKKLESQQGILNRIVDIGADLFAIATVCAYADHLQKQSGKENAADLAQVFCKEARGRIENNFKDISNNADKHSARLAKKLLAGAYSWLEEDIIKG